VVLPLSYCYHDCTHALATAARPGLTWPTWPTWQLLLLSHPTLVPPSVIPMNTMDVNELSSHVESVPPRISPAQQQAAAYTLPPRVVTCSSNPQQRTHIKPTGCSLTHLSPGRLACCLARSSCLLPKLLLPQAACSCSCRPVAWPTPFSLTDPQHLVGESAAPSHCSIVL